LRAYRIGSARFEDWCLQELGRRTDNAAIVSAAGLRIAGVTNAYIDKVSEEGARRDFALSGASVGGDGIRFAFGEPGLGVAGFRRTHQQALSAQAVALAAGSSGQPVITFGQVAPLALMSGSIDLLRAWVIETLRTLADDDEHNARLRETLRVFLQENGSYKTTAERLTLHKNTVQYRVRKAEESLGRPVIQDRLQVELALLASQWLGAAVLRPAVEPETRPARPDG